VLLPDALTTDFSYNNNPESQRGFKLLEDRLRGPRQAQEVVVIQSSNLTVDDEAFKAQVESIHAEIVALGPEIVSSAVNFYQTGAPDFVSADRRSTIMPVQLTGEQSVGIDNVPMVLDIVKKLNASTPFTVVMAGEASVAFESNEVIEADLIKGESIGGLIALLILVAVIGAVLAGIIPLIMAIFSIVVALGLVGIIGLQFQFSFFVTNIITMIGLAVGIDYSLFIISRYREERASGLDKHEAIAKSGATATRAVFFSGVTVVIALAGMLLVPTNIYASLGTGAILVVLASMAASLTLLPAILSLMGNSINWLRVPFLSKSAGSQDLERGGGFWDTITKVVMRQPVLALVLTAGLLIAISTQLFDMETGFNGVETFPDHLQSKQAFEILEKEFSFGLVSPTEIVVDADLNSQSVQDGIQRLVTALEADPSFVGAPTITENDSRDLALISVPIADASSRDATQIVARLHDDIIPAAFAGVPGEVLVTGITAFNMDFFKITDQFLPIVFVFVLAMSFILLTVVFRSIVVAFKAIIMNLLSVGAAYGLIVLVFQKGFAADFFGFTQTPIIDDWIPLFLFSVLFGLSMDYQVFLLSRIRERYDQTRDNTESVAYGLRSTGRLITGAALIMVAVFGGFAAGDLVALQQMGFGLGVAVLIDATIIRSILVPSAMKLLGNANWYLPSFLNWLPDFRVEPVENEAEIAAAD
jgi:RND superfamily putative drug exporter